MKKSVYYASLFGCAIVALGLVCAKPLWARQSRLSAAVALVNKGAEIASFLRQPSFGYVQAYVRFRDTLADDVVMLIDQEFIEGVKNPIYVSGGDWMAFIGLQRTGKVWVAMGNEATMEGKPSTERAWRILDLNAKLQPEVWYRIEVQADFSTRTFKSFTIEGPEGPQTLDLSMYKLDYPNYMPFSERTMSYFVGAMRGRNMMKEEGTPQAFFDDVEGGAVMPDGSRLALFKNGFEEQSEIGNQPVTSPVIALDGYQQGYWYKEKDEALVSIQRAAFAHGGKFVGVADANLHNR